MLLIGLAVGVDYAMFYIRREREERARGRDPQTALAIAAATSGRSVLVSGLTVVVAMSGMYLSGMLLFAGFGTAAILVVLVAMTGSVTVLPALLSLLGDRVELGRVPGLGRMRRPGGGSRIWSAILRVVLRRPAVSVALAVLFLLTLAAPVTGIHTERLSMDKLLPADVGIMRSYERITDAFPGGPNPADVVVTAPDVRSPQVAAALAAFESRVATEGLGEPYVLVTEHPAQGVVEAKVTWPATARTPRRSGRSSDSATTSYPPRSGRSPAPGPTSPATWPSPRTSTPSCSDRSSRWSPSCSCWRSC
jgi:RND superfamily putative drug exporter